MGCINNEFDKWEMSFICVDWLLFAFIKTDLKCILAIRHVNVSGVIRSSEYSTGGQYLDTYAPKMETC
jgi:hypothetical protein